MHDAISIRPMGKTDTEFIYASWLNHYKDSSQFAKRIRRDIFYSNHHYAIEKCLSSATVSIAHPKDEPDIIIGFLVRGDLGRCPVVHFLFVKRAFRKMGIAKALIFERQIDLNNAVATHWTQDMDWISCRYPDLVYDPYRFLRG